MRLILVRHGESLYNAQKRFTGQSDIPLDAVGEQQVEALGQHLSTTKLDVIVSSNLQRARATAQAIARYHGLPVEEDADLREIDFGEWEGFTYDEVLARDAASVERWRSDPATTAPPGGETVIQLRDRVARAFERWQKLYLHGTALWAVHGGVIEVLLCYLLRVELNRRWEFRQNNASITEVDVAPEGTVLVRLNETVQQL